MHSQREESIRRYPAGLISLAVLVTIALFVNPSRSFPADMCTSDSECEDDHCCVLSMDRYSIPRCHQMRPEGQLCRKASELTHNLTLHYPNGKSLDLKGVHILMCACAEGNYCDSPSGVCVKR